MKAKWLQAYRKEKESKHHRNGTEEDTSLFYRPIECPAVWRWLHGMNKRARDEMMYGPVGVPSYDRLGRLV
ncbi:hypothetical protein CDAR_168291 [Caerostris darwini]|uniref:Uncharacterized protein n=1 Tax=Caerostris darwini TaxID=1538125 RepID=A0AAV4T694_9ARAC|nr:hypothetical protein CDAR_168291 [Caerostris darwini]